ncbi:amidohydrolase [Buchananella hordeovulneris]|uniref:amidohydrolase n=1 Tax=Buchananella hordeovulneris TaxID=52770 RepID=UPI000F5E319D|nr:amidohydrolase [Buchananella hordeovulneris]RRD43290.1 M20 family peptidase [Buchananella hordeovulneris]
MTRLSPSALPTPTPPSTAYAGHVAAQIARRRGEQAAALPPEQGASEADQATLAALTEELGSELVALAHQLHAHPEVGFAEHQSVAAVAELLARHGHTATVGLGSLDTALRVEFGPATAPALGICCEYDALPGIGHACGHNVMAATAVGAFLTLAQLERTRPGSVPARIVLLGTPAEEGGTGKETMIRQGDFNDLACAVMTHAYGYDLADQLWLGCRRLTVTFTGVAAHASSQPHMGRNAMDAAALFYQGVGLLRQHMAPGDRLHAVVTEGGQRASIIPEEAVVKMYVRSQEADTLRDLCERVDDCAAGAALMTGCGVQVRWDPRPPVLPVRTNETMTAAWVRAQQRRGRRPLPRGVVPETLAASTDFGNVSQLMPAIHPLLKIAPEEVALHTRAMAEAAASPAADAACVDGAYGLAAVLLDLAADRQLLAAAQAEFAAVGGPISTTDLF